MGRVTVELDFREIDARTSRTLGRTARVVGGRTTALMGARIWSWPGNTRRRSGELAGKTRNVVDLGTLRDSLREPQEVSARHWRLTWNAEYAAAVFLGAVFRKRAASLPARNVPLAAVRTLNLGQTFARSWKE